jgi:hypothetical protein
MASAPAAGRRGRQQSLQTVALTTLTASGGDKLHRSKHAVSQYHNTTLGCGTGSASFTAASSVALAGPLNAAAGTNVAGPGVPLERSGRPCRLDTWPMIEICDLVSG